MLEPTLRPIGQDAQQLSKKPTLPLGGSDAQHPGRAEPRADSYIV